MPLLSHSSTLPLHPKEEPCQGKCILFFMVSYRSVDDAGGSEINGGNKIGVRESSGEDLQDLEKDLIWEVKETDTPKKTDMLILGDRRMMVPFTNTET